MNRYSAYNLQGVREQIERVIGGNNIIYYDNLRKIMVASEDGMVDVSLMCTLDGIKEYLGLKDVTADTVPKHAVRAVAGAIRESTLLRISKDGKRVGRVNPMPNRKFVGQTDANTIAAYPFNNSVSVLDVLNMVAKHGEVRSIDWAPDVGGVPRTAFIEFFENKDALKIMEEKLQFGGSELNLKTKSLFDEEMAKQEVQKIETKDPKDCIVEFYLKMGVVAEPKSLYYDEVVADLKRAFQSFGPVKHINLENETGQVMFEFPATSKIVRSAVADSDLRGLVVNNFIAYVDGVTGGVEEKFSGVCSWEGMVTDDDVGRPNKVPKH